jgi:hypothetical protein
MSAPAAESGVTRRQTLDALDDMAWKDIPQPWHAVLTRARSLAYELTGLGAALDAIDALYIPADPNHPRAESRRLDSERVPSAWRDGRPRPGMHVAVADAAMVLNERWLETLYRYGRLAQAAVDLIAAGGVPSGWINERLPGEPKPALLDSEQVDPPLCVLPEPLWNDPEWVGVRAATGRAGAAMRAAQEYHDLTTRDDPDTGEEREYLPEHFIDDANALADEADDLPFGVAEYADAVVHLLATRPDLLPAGEVTR